MYKYKVRPGYGSKKLLIEFAPKRADKIFISHLLGALEELNVEPLEVLDLWMNDETLYKMKSDAGEFDLSIDVWDFVFIMSENNQQIIAIIDDLLRNNRSFEKENVDFKEYR